MTRQMRVPLMEELKQSHRGNSVSVNLPPTEDAEQFRQVDSSGVVEQQLMNLLRRFHPVFLLALMVWLHILQNHHDELGLTGLCVLWRMNCK